MSGLMLPLAVAAALLPPPLAALPAGTAADLKRQVMSSKAFQQHVEDAMPVLCKGVSNVTSCRGFVGEAIMCLELAERRGALRAVPGAEAEWDHCKGIDKNMPSLGLLTNILAAPSTHRRQVTLLQQASRIQSWARGGLRAQNGLRGGRSQRLSRGPEEKLAKEMTHDLEMNFNKIAPFGKEDTAKELQDHAAKTQDTLVDAVENAEVAEIKRAVFRALTRLRAATIKEFDTIARLETQAIDAYNDAHHYRGENPLAHLHEDEAPVETDKLKSFH